MQNEAERNLKKYELLDFTSPTFANSRYTKDVRVLYVEDEKYLAEAVVHLLRKAKIMVDWAEDGARGLDLAVHGEYDCIVLDIMLPEISGREILQTLRMRKIATPVIMLSALAEVDDKVRALDDGADDYLAKPFKTTELIARLKALVRRPPVLTRDIITFGDLEFDHQNCLLNGMELTAKEAKILELLMRQPQKILAKERLLAYAWGSSETVSENYVEVYVSHLRNKLKQLDSKVKIVTLRNLGYKLVENNNVS